jgi:hypothetical protein
LHAARDRFTPRYVHRHSEEEVRGWFHSAGYINANSVTQREFPKLFPVDFMWNTGVAGVRSTNGYPEQSAPPAPSPDQHAAFRELAS